MENSPNDRYLEEFGLKTELEVRDPQRMLEFCGLEPDIAKALASTDLIGLHGTPGLPLSNEMRGKDRTLNAARRCSMYYATYRLCFSNHARSGGWEIEDSESASEEDWQNYMRAGAPNNNTETVHRVPQLAYAFGQLSLHYDKELEGLDKLNDSFYPSIHPDDIAKLFGKYDSTIPRSQVSERLRSQGLTDMSRGTLDARIENIVRLIQVDAAFAYTYGINMVMYGPKSRQTKLQNIMEHFPKSISPRLPLQVEAIQEEMQIFADLSQMSQGVEKRFWSSWQNAMAMQVNDFKVMLASMYKLYGNMGYEVPEFLSEKLFFPVPLDTRGDDARAGTKENIPQTIEEKMAIAKTAHAALLERVNAENNEWMLAHGKNFRPFWLALQSIHQELELPPPLASCMQREFATLMQATARKLYEFSQAKSLDVAQQLLTSRLTELQALGENVEEFKQNTHRDQLRSPDLGLPALFPAQTCIDTWRQNWKSLSPLIRTHWPSKIATGPEVADEIWKLISQPEQTSRSERLRMHAGAIATNAIRPEARLRRITEEEQWFITSYGVEEVEQQAESRGVRSRSPQKSSTEMNTQSAEELDINRLLGLGELKREFEGKLYRLPYGWRGKGAAAYALVLEKPALASDTDSSRNLYAVVEVPRKSFATYILPIDAVEDCLEIVKNFLRSETIEGFDAYRLPHQHYEERSHIDQIREALDFVHAYRAEGG